ncbi:TATA box-binding protein-associated factor RNA polymerase I subunit C isoform 3-T3 [Liasis olivaceus]
MRGAAMAAFPGALLPGPFRAGPPGRDGPGGAPRAAGWGQRGPVGVAPRGPGRPPRFVPRRRRRARERWEPAEAAPLPLQPPGAGPRAPAAGPGDLLCGGWAARPGAALDFAGQLRALFEDHPGAAFGATARLLHEHVYLGDAPGPRRAGGVCGMTRLLRALEDRTRPGGRAAPDARRPLSGVGCLCRDWLCELPLPLLAEWAHEELAERWTRLCFDDSPTGGALAWLPGEPARRGCLVFPAGAAADRLCFQDVALRPAANGSLRPRIRGRPTQFELNGAVRQVAAVRLEGSDFLGVRSGHFCAAWRRRCGRAPVPLRVVCTDAPCSSIAVSPHLPGELSICTLEGAVYLWHVEMGLRRLHQDSDSMFFRDPSPWRWSEFSAHPRVLTFADRTGLKGLDQRFSAFVLDERFPLVPVLRWEHMMQWPPIYAHLTPAGALQHSHTVLLGTHHSQELLLLQYSGGHSLPCQLQGAPQKLPSTKECLPHFPAQVPVRQSALSQRLSVPTAGIAAALGQQDRTQTLLVFQLSEAGDLFYQPLLLQAGGEEAGGQAPTDSGLEASFGGAAVDGPCRDSVHPDDTSSRTACTPAATALYRRWLRAFLRTWKRAPAQGNLRPPTTISQSSLFTHREMRELAGSVPPSLEASCHLRKAMQEQRLLCSWGDESRAPVPPAPQGPPGELGQRLAASWSGDWAAWWLEKLGSTTARRRQALREQRQRAKRHRGTRSLSGSFTSSTSYQSDLSDWSGGSKSPAPRPAPAVALEPPLHAPPVLQPGSREDSELLSSQTLHARGIPRERCQTLRRYLAVLDEPPEPPPEEDLPASQTSTLGGSQRGPSSSQGSQLKRARMGF